MWYIDPSGAVLISAVIIYRWVDVINEQVRVSEWVALELYYDTIRYHSTLHYITLHYITLHYITLHYTTLHNSNLFTLLCLAANSGIMLPI
jgi:hypothetical protein